MNQRGPWPIHQNRTPEPYRASTWDESGVFTVEKRRGRNINHFFIASFRVWKDDSTKTRIQIRARQYCGPLGKRWFNHCLLLFLKFYTMQGMGKGIASYLRNPMTKQYIKFLIKADSVNESVLPRNQAPTLSVQESPAAALNLGSTASFAESNFIWIFVQCCVISLLK